MRVVEPPGWSAPVGWPDDLELVATETPADDGEIVVVHLGNNPHHLWLLDRLGASSNAVAVLHDTVLHHLLVESISAGNERTPFPIISRRPTAHPVVRWRRPAAPATMGGSIRSCSQLGGPSSNTYGESSSIPDGLKTSSVASIRR